ncbi:MAG TPA: PHB depolymerase family esterase [Cyclobacteriaceae bacterium]|jgi:polyhydroxybutyrate depolymerase
MKNLLIKCFLLLPAVVLINCDDNSSAQPYRIESTLEVDSRMRNYVLVLPPTYYNSSEDLPLVIALHGGGGSARQMERMYGLNEKAASAGFILIYPEGIRGDGPLGARTWNAGRCCEDAMENDVDDVEFISVLIDRIVADFRVDSKRVYVTGMSNGGMMAYRLACELSHKIAAIAPVSATLMANTCKPERAVPVLHIHSLLDTKVPYEGGTGIRDYDFTPVDSVLRIMADLAKCGNTPQRIGDGKVIITRWTDCTDGVTIESHVTHDGGHSWPGAKDHPAWADMPSAYVNANDLMWEFFQRFRLP